MILDELKTFLLQYHGLKDAPMGVMPRIDFDILGKDDVVYCLIQTPASPIVKEYIDGSCIRQTTVVFQTLNPVSTSILEMLDNIGFYDDFTKWIYQANINQELPTNWVNIECQTLGYLYDVAETQDKATYQITINVQYKEEANESYKETDSTVR